MDKSLATELVDALAKCQRVLDGAEVVARKVGDPTERDRIRTAIMKASGVLYTEVMLGIISEHPDLDPHRPSGGS